MDTDTPPEDTEAAPTSAAGETLITGATGRVGAGLLAQFAARGVPARAAVRQPGAFVSPPNVTPVHFDLQKPQTWQAALAGVRRMFLLWPPGTSPKKHIYSFVQAAHTAGVRRVAFLSIFGADRMGFLPHRQIERYIEASGMAWVFLRAGYFMQNFSSVHRADIRDRDEIFLPAGDGRISAVDVPDVSAAAYVGLMERSENLAWDLTGPAALNTGDVARILGRVLGRPIRNAKPGPLAFLRAQVRRGSSLGFALFMLAEYTHARLGLAGRLGRGVQEALGRSPTPFEAFARREAAVWHPRPNTTPAEPLAPTG